MTQIQVLSKSAERRYTLGVVYEPDVLDTDKEFAKAEDIEGAAHAYMVRLQAAAAATAGLLKSALAGDQEFQLDVTEAEELLKSFNPLDDEHLQVSENLGQVVESYIAPTDMTIGGQLVKKGSWLMGVIWTEEMFKKVKAGERTGFSMFGRTSRMEA